jgi:3-oxoacyl-[acyl-carrier protein] reductase
MEKDTSDTNKTDFVVITGANGGLGQSIANALAIKGYSLILCTRKRDDDFQAWASRIANLNGIQVEFMNFDFQHPSEVKAASGFLVKTYKIYGLVNCAGMPFGSTILMTKVDDLRMILEVNFINQVLFSQPILRLMCKQKSGSIVNISSMSSLMSQSGTFAYGASKSAMNHFTKVAAAETGRFGVRVNAICPGLVQTNMLKEMDPEALLKLVEKSALSRVATPEEIASLVCFLISPESSYISGEVIKINGGEV